MSGVATAIVGGAVVGGYFSSRAAKGAAETAAGAQTDAAAKAAEAELEGTKLAIEEQKRQFDILQERYNTTQSNIASIQSNIAGIQTKLEPYITAGNTAFTQQMNLIGVNGTEAQETAIKTLENSPLYTSLVQQGEEAILSNASATGNLRGGNTQAALAEYRPSVLSNLIESQYSKLSGISSLGQQAVLGQGNLAVGASSVINTGSNTGSDISSNIAKLYQSQGSSLANMYTTSGTAAAQAALLSGRAEAQSWSDIGRAIGIAAREF